MKNVSACFLFSAALLSAAASGPFASGSPASSGRGDVAPGKEDGRQTRLGAGDAWSHENRIAKALARMSARKIELPEDAKHNGRKIDPNVRIAALCGYELGAIYRGSLRGKVTDDGEIVVTEKLQRPFRRCTHATLTYSSENFGLYKIRIFSEPLSSKVIGAAAAPDELQTMAGVFSTKFVGKIKSWQRRRTMASKLSGGGERLVASFATKGLVTGGQNLSVGFENVEMTGKGALRSGNQETGLTFFAELEDVALRGIDKSKAMSSGERARSAKADVDAL